MSSDERSADRSFELHVSGELVRFVVRVCVVAAVITISAIVFTGLAIQRLEDSTARILDKFHLQGGREFWSRIERELDRAAQPSSDLPPEEKEKILNDLHVIAARWRPFLDAVESGTGKQTSNSVDHR
jgi:hypothetical protein